MLRLVTPGELANRTGPGAKLLRPLAGGAAPTRSGLERRFLGALRASAVPEPIKEHPLGRYDRVRDAELAVRDLVVIRVSDQQVDHDLPATIDRLERWFSGPGATRADRAPAPARAARSPRTR